MRALLAVVLALAAGAANAMFSGSIVDAPYVAKAIARGAIVIDVRPAEAYFDGHLPGAVRLDVPATFLDDKTQRFAPIAHIDSSLGAAGIDLKREIVVYGSPASSFAYATQFALEYFGAPRVHVFHQGFEGWRAARRPFSTAAVERKPVRIRPFANPAMLATSGEVIARIGSPSVQFLDVRRPGEFNGDQADTLRGGHIPGAINIPYDAALVDPDTPHRLMMKETTDASGAALKSRKKLKALYAALDPRKEIVVYCEVGLRAAVTASILARLGYHSVRLYMPGWAEYGNLPDAPVEQ